MIDAAGGSDTKTADARKADRVLDLLRSLADVRGSGRDVDYLSHSLQVASRAEAAGADDEMVVAALCHDVGHVLPTTDHARIAADLLDGHVAPPVVEIVAHHTAIRAGTDRAAWTGRPWLAAAVRFADEWDRPAGGPTAPAPTLESFEQRVRRVFGSRRSSSPVDLGTLLGGMTTVEFLRDRFGRHPFADVGGSRTRFDHLLDLAGTEQLILRHHRDRAEMDGGGRFRERVQIDRVAAPVESELFHRSLDLPIGELAVLDVGRVSALLGEGNRVTVHAVDELDATRAHLTSSVAEALGHAASMRAVATWSPGEQAVAASPRHQFVLHLAGSRQWRLEPGVAQALAGSDLLGSDQVLETGDVLYVPAHWSAGWTDHEAPALHLVIDVADAPPNDLFELMRTRLTELEVFREDLPVTASREEQSAYAARLQAAFLDLLR